MEKNEKTDSSPRVKDVLRPFLANESEIPDDPQKQRELFERLIKEFPEVYPPEAADSEATEAEKKKQ